jgi:diacylglycerol kinase family enzyme
MKVLVLVNPRAGNNLGEVWLNRLDRAFRTGQCGTEEWTVEPTQVGDLRTQLASRTSCVDRVIIVGGDGTVSGVLNAMTSLRIKVPAGIIPLGTGNDLARSLGLPTGRPWSLAEVMAYIRSDRTVPLDLWSINGTLTFNNYLSVGLDAQVVRGFSRIRRWIQKHPFWGRRGIYFSVYLMVWLAHLGGRVPQGSTLIWMNEGGSLQKRTLSRVRVVSLTNTPYYAAGALMDPEAQMGDGLFEITLFPHMRAYAEMMAMRIPHLAGKGIQMRWWRVRAKEAELRLGRPTSVQADGEDITDSVSEDPILRISPSARLQILLLPEDRG